MTVVTTQSVKRRIIEKLFQLGGKGPVVRTGDGAAVKFGSNKLNEKKKKTNLQRFFEQFKDERMIIYASELVPGDILHLKPETLSRQTPGCEKRGIGPVRRIGFLGKERGRGCGGKSCMRMKQVGTAAGQCSTMYLYDKFFSDYNKTIAQILLNMEDTPSQTRQ